MVVSWWIAVFCTAAVSGALDMKAPVYHLVYCPDINELEACCFF